MSHLANSVLNTSNLYGLERRFHQNLCWWEAGTGTKVFLFLHGIPGSAFTWAKVASLVSAEYRVLVPDLPGFGDSLASSKMSITGIGQFLKEFLATQNISELVIAGHDYGVILGLWLGRALIKSGILKGIILADGNVFPDPAKQYPDELQLKYRLLNSHFAKKTVLSSRIGANYLYNKWVENKIKFPKEQFLASYTSNSRKNGLYLSQRIWNGEEKVYIDLLEFLNKMQLKTMLIWGGNSPTIKGSYQLIKERIPTAYSFVYDNCGRYIPAENPEELSIDILNTFKSI